MDSKKIITIDLIAVILYAIFGGFLFFLGAVTGEDALFQNITIYRLTLVLIPIHIIVGIACSILLHKREWTKHKFQISKRLVIANIVIILAPYVVPCVIGIIEILICAIEWLIG